ncbi:DUF4349 domain-containing protein [Enterococcus olivae]
MKVNKEWQTQWENIELPEEKIKQAIDTALQDQPRTNKTSFSKKIRHFFQRPVYRRGIIAAAILLIITMSASQLLGYFRDASTETSSEMAFLTNDAASDYALDQKNYQEAATEGQVPFTEADSVEEPANTSIASDKTSYFYMIDKETTDFDADTEKIQQLTMKLGGYIENSSIETPYYSSGNRYATFILRIPADQTTAFLEELKPLGHTLSENLSSTNHSLAYSDNESRISALQAEEDALLSMLEKSGTVEEALQIQEQLTRIRTEREQLSRENRGIDNQVDFTTFTLTFNEITEIQEAEKSESAFTKIKNNWQKQLLGWQNFFVQLGIFLASNIFYLIGILIVAVVTVIYWKKKNTKKTKI